MKKNKYRCFSYNWEHSQVIIAYTRRDAINFYETRTGFRCYSCMRLRKLKISS